jgi:hypothetical protein
MSGSLCNDIVLIHNDQPTTHKLEAQAQQTDHTVISTVRSQSTPAVSSGTRTTENKVNQHAFLAVYPTLEVKARCSQDDGREELEPQISLQERPLFLSLATLTNGHPI